MSTEQGQERLFGEDDDPDLRAIESEIYATDPTGERIARVIRDTFDQLYDGQHTGRWCFDQLHKTEKTHMGTLVEINLHREFRFGDGDVTDYKIANVEVDCKYSMTYGGWELPPEAINHFCLLIAANDAESTWRAGLLKIKEPYLRARTNRDAKRQLKADSRASILRLWPRHGRLEGNLFLQLDPLIRARIFAAKGKRGQPNGQARTNELFRAVQGRIIRRAELATVAQQDDFMKRARGNGGARTALQQEGILVLGHQDNDPLVAAALGLAVPKKGEFISARVVRAQSDRSQHVAIINGEYWRMAAHADPVIAAPSVPRKLS